ncbi:hypothetical protein Emed_006808 [Eimeria media]
MAKYSSSATPAVLAGLAVASTLLLAYLLRKTWWSSSSRRNEQDDSPSSERRAGGKKGTSHFEDACAAVELAADGLPGASRLELYALYKQALEGDCEEEEPSRLQAVARSKWAAWRAKRGVTSEEAKAAYVQLAADLGLLEEMQEDARDGRSGLGPVHSRPVMADNQDTSARSKGDQICCFAAEGDLESIRKALEGEGFVDIVRLLIDRGADVNHTDDSGETPLHVAIAADQDEIVALLIDAGADTSIKNNEGNSCAELLEQNKASKG